LIAEGEFMPITKYEGRTFTNQAFQLEECWFINCVLRECVIFYGGGTYEFQNTTFQNCQWKFQDRARNTCQLLVMIGLLQPGQAPPEMIPNIGGPVN
jgi:hypothetical protein